MADVKPELRPSPYKPPLSIKAAYVVFLDGERIGQVQHKKIEITRQYVQWNSQAGHSVRYNRRVRPLCWLASGPFGQEAVRTRADAVAVLVKQHQIQAHHTDSCGRRVEHESHRFRNAGLIVFCTGEANGNAQN